MCSGDLYSLTFQVLHLSRTTEIILNWILFKADSKFETAEDDIGSIIKISPLSWKKPIGRYVINYYDHFHFFTKSQYLWQGQFQTWPRCRQYIIIQWFISMGTMWSGLYPLMKCIWCYISLFEFSSSIMIDRAVRTLKSLKIHILLHRLLSYFFFWETNSCFNQTKVFHFSFSFSCISWKIFLDSFKSLK